MLKRKVTREQAVEGLVSAAIQFRAQAAIIQTMRAAPQCSEYEKPDWVHNYPGQDACDIFDADASHCQNCAVRFVNRPAYLEARKKRALARRHLMKWASVIAALQPMTTEAPRD